MPAWLVPGVTAAAGHRHERLPRGRSAGSRYLQEFFGVPESSFSVCHGQPRDLGTASRLDRETRSWPVPVSRASPAVELARAVAWPAGTSRRADSAPPALRPSPAAVHEMTTVPSAGRAVFEALASRRLAAVPVPLRAHLFVRTVRGMWACANPACSGVPEAERKNRDASAACSRSCLDLSRLRVPRPRTAVLLRMRRRQPRRFRGRQIAEVKAEDLSLALTPSEIPALESQPVFAAPARPVHVVLAGRAANPGDPRLAERAARWHTGQVRLRARRAGPALGLLRPAVGTPPAGAFP